MKAAPEQTNRQAWSAIGSFVGTIVATATIVPVGMIAATSGENTTDKRLPDGIPGARPTWGAELPIHREYSDFDRHWVQAHQDWLELLATAHS